MTFARYSRALWADDPAKLANPAKVEQKQDVVAANLWLTSAKVDEGAIKFSPALAKLSPAKSAEDLDFSRLSHFSQHETKSSSGSGQDGIIQSWRAGVDALFVMPQPKAYPVDEWILLLDDADRFMKRWAEQAVDIGWHSWDIWGVDRSAPRFRFDRMGLIPSLRGLNIKAMTNEAAVIQTQTSNLLRFYRRPLNPMNGRGRVLVWDLA